MTIYKVTDTKTDASVYCEFHDTASNIAAVMFYNKPLCCSPSLESLVKIFSQAKEYSGIKIEEIYVI